MKRSGVRGVRAVRAFGVVLAVLLAAPAVLAAQQTPGVSIVFLVRHAEKATDDPADPTLTEAGQARAAELDRMLADVPLTSIHSTDYRRTLQTAAPLAQRHGVHIERYDPRDEEAMKALVERLRTTPGHHLVSGHSNTTPDFVRALGGDPISAIDESEYDRLYVVVIGPEGTTSSALLRFGARSGGS